MLTKGVCQGLGYFVYPSVFVGRDHKVQHWVVQHGPEVGGASIHRKSCPAVTWRENGLDKQTWDFLRNAFNACSWVLSLIKLLACFDLYFNKASLLYLYYTRVNVYIVCVPLLRNEWAASCLGDISGQIPHRRHWAATPRVRIVSKSPGVGFSRDVYVQM